MDLSDFKKTKLPDQPGVYFFKKGRQILYIGKATSLHDRVRSYFSQDLNETRGPLLVKMLSEATTLNFQQTDSVLEALILEAALIRRHRPLYNTRAKDDKSYWHIIITKEVWPQVLMVRGKDLIETIEPASVKYTFGPFPQAAELKVALKIIRKIFPFRDKCQPAEAKGGGRPCFSAQLGLCPGVCSGSISQTEYARLVNHLRLFFEGKKVILLKKLEQEMKQLSRQEKFEEALVRRNQIFALQHINDIALLKASPSSSRLRIEAYDIAHLVGRHTVGVMTVILGGVPEKNAYRRFGLRGLASDKVNDIANLQEVLERRLNHPEWPWPELVVVDGGKAQLKVAKAILDNFGLTVPVVAVVKNEKHQPREILGDNRLTREYESEILLANSEAHRFAISYHRTKSRRGLR